MDLEPAYQIDEFCPARSRSHRPPKRTALEGGYCVERETVVFKEAATVIRMFLLEIYVRFLTIELYCIGVTDPTEGRHAHARPRSVDTARSGYDTVPDFAPHYATRSEERSWPRVEENS